LGFDKSEAKGFQERTGSMLQKVLDNEIRHFKDLPDKLKRWIVVDAALRIVEKYRETVPHRSFEGHPICTACGHWKCPECPVHSSIQESHVCPAMRLLGRVSGAKYGEIPPMGVSRFVTQSKAPDPEPSWADIAKLGLGDKKTESKEMGKDEVENKGADVR